MGPVWAVPDPSLVARTDAIVRRFDERRELERRHADVGLKLTAPVLSFSERWEATWDGGHVEADDDIELCAIVRQLLGDQP
jgi:hypothetical protein